MKIAVVNTMAPFVSGGAEQLADHLVTNLRLGGHDAALLRMPFAWDPYDKIPSEIVRLKMLELDAFDRVISLKFPVYLLSAKHHTTWLIHQYRQAYDLWGTPFTNLPNNRDGRAVRDHIIAHDNAALASRDRLFTISGETSKRLCHYNGITADPLRAPINDPELFTGGNDQGYILAPGRINATKRQSIAVEAIKFLPRGTQLIVAGPPDSREDESGLRQLVQDHDLGDRVRLDLRFLSRQELANYVNNARAIVYLPFLEDSFGYVTMEAFEAGKPVITTHDSGELLTIVLDGQTGTVVEARPEAVARAMASYSGNERKARRHGGAGHALWRAKNINWSENIKRLVDG